MSDFTFCLYFYIRGSGSVLGIWIHKAPKYGSNTYPDPDPQHWLFLFLIQIYFLNEYRYSAPAECSGKLYVMHLLIIALNWGQLPRGKWLYMYSSTNIHTVTNIFKILKESFCNNAAANKFKYLDVLLSHFTGILIRFLFWLIRILKSWRKIYRKLTKKFKFKLKNLKSKS